MTTIAGSLLHAGAGKAITYPLNHSHTQLQQHVAEKSISALTTETEGQQEEAYYVTPASHIGRVVTGVVLVADEPQQQKQVSKFSLSTICFADKLAEQGYKVLVIQPTGKEMSALKTVDQAVLFLRQKQDVQRVAVLGVGGGADLAIRIALNPSSVVDCAIIMCPDVPTRWNIDSASALCVPTLVLMGERNPAGKSEQYRALLALAKGSSQKNGDEMLRARIFPNQGKGFAFFNITEEDAATQAIAEVLDWLVIHLHRFRVAAATSDTDPWWPQGRNGPFCNIGLQQWQEIRMKWITPTQTPPPRPPPVPTDLLFDGLSSVRRTFDLPQRMRLGDVVELFVEIWDVQQ